MKVFVIIFFLVLSATNVSSADYSSLEVALHSYDLNGAFSVTTNAHFMVVDSLGRMTGKNPFTGEDKGEIPGSGYSVESLGEIKEGGDSSNAEDILPGPETVSFEMGPVQISGMYGVRIYGIRDTKYSLSIRMNDSEHKVTVLEYENYISSGATNGFNVNINPTPGAPAPVITKTVTFDILRNDVKVSLGLNQLGDDKFADSLAKTIGLAEKLAGVCDKRKAKKDKCEPAVNALKLFVKRLELANKKCDKAADCDEEREWTAFRKEHDGDKDYKDFFRDWDKDKWHKQKKTCKRFVSDEALKIISEDAQWLIKSLGGETSGGKR